MKCREKSYAQFGMHLFGYCILVSSLWESNVMLYEGIKLKVNGKQ